MLPSVSAAVRKIAVIAANVLPTTISRRDTGAARNASSVFRSFSPAVMSMTGYMPPVNISRSNT